MEGKIADLSLDALQDRGLNVTRRLGTLSTLRAGGAIAESRGPTASKRRDSVFRRMLVLADAVAIVGAFVLTMALSSKSIQLTWASIAGLPILLVCAKLVGLYDRDDMLLRKTTLDEVPKLFHVATMCALVAWLAGGLIVAGSLDRHQALFLWLMLALLLVLMRTIARALALRTTPAERCVLIGDAASVAMIAPKLREHGGIRANLVAHLDLDKIEPWSTDARSESKLAEVRALARKLDVHRAIVAPPQRGCR
jgi:FlaA1/EpsC-like NDP-sugar epimerase